MLIWFFVGLALAYVVLSNGVGFVGFYAGWYSSFFGVDYSNYSFGRDVANKIFFLINLCLPLIIVSMLLIPTSSVIGSVAVSSFRARVRTVLGMAVLCLPTFFILPRISGPLGLFSRNPYAFSMCIVLSCIVLSIYLRIAFYSIFEDRED